MNYDSVFTNDNRLMFNERAYKIAPYLTLENAKYDYDTAYLYGDKFYLYKGKVAIDESVPGIYLINEYDNGNLKYAKTHLVTTEDEKYNWEGKIGTLNTDELIEMINNKEVVILNYPDVDQTELPEIQENDDILKRLIKKAIQEKRINIDAYKTRFPDKNALFNFKQVIKGDGRLSMLLFDRAVDALNLKYTIILEEAQPNDLIIGVPMEGKITDSSNATYNI